MKKVKVSFSGSGRPAVQITGDYEDPEAGDRDGDRTGHKEDRVQLQDVRLNTSI